MGHGHSKPDGQRTPGTAAHPHVFTAPSDRKFKRKRRRESTTPRYASVLGIAWATALFMTVLSFVRGITGIDIDWWNWHYIADGLVCLALLVTVSFLWEAWEREERYPKLLPKREFDRRYPPGSGAGPSDAEPPESRAFHRRLKYDDDVTMTGGQIPPLLSEAPGAGPDFRPTWNDDHPDPMFQRDDNER